MKQISEDSWCGCCGRSPFDDDCCQNIPIEEYGQRVNTMVDEAMQLRKARVVSGSKR